MNFDRIVNLYNKPSLHSIILRKIISLKKIINGIYLNNNILPNFIKISKILRYSLI